MAAPRTPDFVGIVVAAGSSARLPGNVPKQFEPIGSRTLLEHAVAALASDRAVRGVVAVLPATDVAGERGAAAARLPGVLQVVAGGSTRAESVGNGLAAAAAHEPRFVLVHDAARPAASAALVARVIEATRLHGAAIPALAVVDTVKRVEGSPAGELRVLETLDRSTLRLAQTPQGSRTDWLVAALAVAARSGIVATDEAAALEHAGHAVAVVEGDPANRKVTSPEDLRALRATAAEPRSRLRVGSGFDVHRFEAGRRLVLGGIELAGEVGLAGHSDADVVLHAIMDALLGAAGLGDIGVHFPPGDPRYKDSDSRVLLADVHCRIADLGLRIVNVDVTVLAERPRLQPHVDAMRRAIAETLALESSQVGIKATTLEGLGALGRAEGIAAQAVALLERDEGAP
jgi:2-C-methyl-D-erythritol 4-phosphate cytidylyltransferase / 2-C-methyl-D-erythritol 2,4-cyclodiphosphate synthase